MAMKPFEIQDAGLILGGVQLEAGTTGVVIPGVTQASSYKVEEVSDIDGSNPTLTHAFVIDYVIFNSKLTNIANDVSGYALYTVNLENSKVDEIDVDSEGSYTQQEATGNGSNNLYGYTGTETSLSNALTNFDPNDWALIPFRPKMRAGEIESIGGGGGSSALEGLDDVQLDGPSNGQVLTWNSSQEKWENQDPSGGGGGADTGDVVFDGSSLYVGGTGFLNLDNGDDQAVIGTNGPYQLLISINESDKEWTFDTSGNLRLPPGGDILDSTGTSVLGGGGGADTGSITFNVTALQSPTDSNVGWDNGVISLMPGAETDEGYITRGQYLNIYPTNAEDAPHIHIAAGMNTLTSQLGDLILGNDSQHIDINGAGNIFIKTNNQSKEWTFGMDGKLTLPAGGDIVDSTGTSVLGGGGGSSSLSGLSDVGIDGAADGQILMWVDAQSRWENMNLPTGGTVSQLTNGSYSLSLEDDGNISLPGNTVVSAPDDTTLRIRTSGSAYGATTLEYVTNINGVTPYNAKVRVAENGVSISTSGDAKQWLFNPSGTLKLPYQSIITATENDIVNIQTTTDDSHHNVIELRQNNIDLYAWNNNDDSHAEVFLNNGAKNEVTIQVQNAGQTEKIWSFGGDGSIIFPDNTVQTTAYDYAPMKLVNLDGGMASTQFDVSYAYIDCGGSARRGVLSADTFDGEENGATQSSFDKVLNGGGA